jgi:hypothetical protein
MTQQMLKDPKLVVLFGCPSYADLDSDIPTFPERSVSEREAPRSNKLTGCPVPAIRSKRSRSQAFEGSCTGRHRGYHRNGWGGDHLGDSARSTRYHWGCDETSTRTHLLAPLTRVLGEGTWCKTIAGTGSRTPAHAKSDWGNENANENISKSACGFFRFPF